MQREAILVRVLCIRDNCTKSAECRATEEKQKRCVYNTCRHLSLFEEEDNANKEVMEDVFESQATEGRDEEPAEAMTEAGTKDYEYGLPVGDTHQR